MSNRWWSIFDAGQNVRIDFTRLYRIATLVLLTATLMSATALAQTNAETPVVPVLTQQDFPARVDVGTIENLVLQIRHPVGTTVVLESPPNTRRAQLIGQDSTTAPSGNELKTTLTLRYGFFRTGETTLPSFRVNVDSAGKTTPAITTAIQLSVMPVLGAGESLTAPQNPVEMWVDDYTLLWVGGFLIFVFGLGLMTWFVRRRASEVMEELPPRPPYEIAIEKLLGLESSGLLERGDFMVFYVRLSETLREYLGDRYNFPGTELTTTEITLRLANVKWPLGMELSEVKNILSSSDLVKFGGMIPEVAQGKVLLRRAITVVELTKGRFRQPLKVAPDVSTDAESVESETVVGGTVDTDTTDANTETAGTTISGAKTSLDQPSEDDDEWVEEAAELEQAEKPEPYLVETKDESEPAKSSPSLKWQPPEDSP
jgi:hypothetical protein